MTAASPEIEILLGHAGSFRRVPLPALAAVTHLSRSTLHAALSRLLFELLRDGSFEEFGSAEREPPEGETVSDGDGFPGYGSVPNGPHGTVSPEEKENGRVSDGTVTVTTEPSARPASARGEALTAALLADLLDDAASLPFYETLVATVDHRHLHHALDVTLARRAQLHGRPGGYFNAVVRRLTHAHPPYARTPPSTPGAASPRP